MSSDERITKLHNALSTAAGTTLSYKDLESTSSYKAATLRTYVMKNKLAPHVVTAGGQACKVAKPFSLSAGDLRRRLTQRENRYEWEHLGVSELVSGLLERSRTNAGLALELINRPELMNRLDAFVLLLATAWEQLLKAILEDKQEGSIFTGTQTASGRPHTITLGTALERHFSSLNDPVRKNIERMKELRDGAAHLLVPELTGIVTRYFQSSILNFIGMYQGFAEEPPFRFEGSGLLTLGVAYSSPTIDALRVRHGTQADEVHALIKELEDDAQKVDNPQFAISILYELVLEKKASEGAVHLVNAPGGLPVHAVKVPRDPKSVCPHSATEIAKKLSERTTSKWSANDVGMVAEYLGVKKDDNAHHYRYVAGKKTEFHTYSDAFVELVASHLKQSPDLKKLARQQKATSGPLPKVII